MENLQKQKVEALKKINSWCIEFIGDSGLYLKLKRNIYCNGRNHSIHVNEDGISVRYNGYGTLGTCLKVQEGRGSIYYHNAAIELITHWREIKEEIIREKEEREQQIQMIKEFVV